MRDIELAEQLRHVNLTHCLTFLTVVEVGSFRGAADRLHISQSALSVQVRQMERALGVPLLHRTTRRVVLTGHGQLAQAALRRICGDLHRLVAGFREEAALQKGLLSIAVLPSLAATLLPEVVKGFAALHPGVEVRLRDTDSKSAAAMLRNGDVDMGILSRSAALDDFLFTSLFEDDFLVIVPRHGHPLSTRRRVNLDDLRGHTMVLNPRGVDLRENLEALFEGSSISVQPAQEMIASSSLIALVAAGIGLTILPRTAMTGLDLSLCRIVTLHPRRFREIGLFISPERSRNPSVLAFRAMTQHMATA